MTCDRATCWCHADYRVRWIPSMDISYTVEELPSLDNAPDSDNVRTFRYVYIEEGEQHGAS